MIQEEYKIHTAIFKHHQSCFPWVKFVYVPNATHDASTGFFNKQLGLHPGAHDIHIFYNRNAIDEKPSQLRVGIFEVKSRVGKLTSNQNKYASEMHSLGAYTGYGSSVGQYHQTLCKWGLKPLHDSIQEPDLRTPDEKKRDAFQYFAPPRKD